MLDNVINVSNIYSTSAVYANCWLEEIVYKIDIWEGLEHPSVISFESGFRAFQAFQAGALELKGQPGMKTGKELCLWPRLRHLFVRLYNVTEMARDPPQHCGGKRNSRRQDRM